MRDVHAIAQKWLNSNLKEEDKKQIDVLLQNEDQLKEAFYKDLEFGTGGLRGIMGMGSNRMNRYTVGMATQGFANYLLKSFEGQIKVAIAHDSRNNSKEFAQTVADVFAANNIHVYLFDALRPTPELSFTIKHLGCQGGVVLTASHNPKEYNGYKAYWDDGAQLIAPHDKNVMDEVKKIQSIDEVKFNANSNNIELIGEEIDQAYLDKIKALSLSPQAVNSQKDIKIIYSPIHGTGFQLVPDCLRNFGFENVIVVEEQAHPDGNFPTVEYPNPEEKEALSLAIEKAKVENAELIMATDPDSDRVGIAIKNPSGDYDLLNGNQTGSLLVYYILQRWSDLNKFKGNECVIKTIVTTGLIERIANHFDVKCYDTLTGFKYIAALIRELESKETFIVGGEESYGYMISDFVRDKDAVASCAMIAEMCAYAADQGKSLHDLLIDMYSKFGLFQEKLIAITKKGIQGEQEILDMMSRFRNDPPKTLGGSKVTRLIDYQISENKNLDTGKTTKVDLPKSNVLQFITEDDYIISVRPSGTEPKIKFYISANTTLEEVTDYNNKLTALSEVIEKIEKDLESA